MNRNSHYFRIVAIDGGSEPSVVRFSFAETQFGKVLIASTAEGICALDFASDRSAVMKRLKDRFPQAQLAEEQDEWQKVVLRYVDSGETESESLPLLVKGTPFQLDVWNALLEIRMGETTTYGEIAAQIRRPKAVRAVGTAVGSNPISLLIPCHRVLRSDGGIGGYYWGREMKERILCFEEKLRTK